MLLMRSPAEGALAVVGGALTPQATSCFGRYWDGEVRANHFSLHQVRVRSCSLVFQAHSRPKSAEDTRYWCCPQTNINEVFGQSDTHTQIYPPPIHTLCVFYTVNYIVLVIF